MNVRVRVCIITRSSATSTSIGARMFANTRTIGRSVMNAIQVTPSANKGKAYYRLQFRKSMVDFLNAVIRRVNLRIGLVVTVGI